MKRNTNAVNDFKIVKTSIDKLYKIAKFVVKENYEHHGYTATNIKETKDEIAMVYCEDAIHYSASSFYTAENNNQIIGSIKVTKWDRKIVLPIQKIFNINVGEMFDKNVTVWHVGRFAISSNSCCKIITLLKRLMVYAIYPVCESDDSVMVAECDQKLLRTLIALGIKTKTLGTPVHYLGSDTIPICVEKNGLVEFLNRNLSLYKS